MALIKKNIWWLFITILFIGTVLLGYFASDRWNEIQSNYDTKQKNLVELTSNAAHSLFISQEMLLDVVGYELIKDPDFLSQVKAQPILDKLLQINPALVGFGLATPTGKLTLVSSNLANKKLPNLLDQESSRLSFQEALNSNRMVLGRTYYLEALDQFLIPIRKAIRDEKGDVIAVMTAGLRIQGASRFFSNQIHLGEYNSITLLRSSDFYPQFYSAGSGRPKLPYDKSLADSKITSYSGGTKDGITISLQQLEPAEGIIQFESSNALLESEGYAIHDDRYRFWVASMVNKKQILNEFLASFLAYLAVYLLVLGVLYSLFRIIVNAEKQQHEALLYQATHDPLTLLPNRSYLLTNIDRWITPAQTPFSVFFVDMDLFKNINDSFGHEFGDKVLKELAKRLQKCIPSKATVIRQGGDEFLVLLNESNSHKLLTIAKKILAELSRKYEIQGVGFELGVSIGISTYPNHGSALDELLRAADIAMYEAKKYRNTVRLFADSMLTEYQQKLAIESQLNNALANNELFMVYQPQVTKDGQLYGVEALVRWKNDTLGLVPPDRFIPIAETTGLMPRIGDFILQRTMQDTKQIQYNLGIDYYLSINISVRQFMHHSFMESLTSAIEESGLRKVSIVIEITESLFIDDLDYILPILKRIHDMGMQISMDDFGTGYSSLNMLSTLPIDELKVDKSFVDNILNDAAARKMIQNIISIGKNYDMSVIAEGVETQDQVDLLQSYGCDRFQGYYFAKPMTCEDLEKYLAS